MKKVLCIVAGLLTVIGALNWGFVGLFDVNIVNKLLGTMPQLEKIVYILVGLSGLVSGMFLVQDHSHKD
jgi:hypothetical protein